MRLHPLWSLPDRIAAQRGSGDIGLLQLDPPESSPDISRVLGVPGVGATVVTDHVVVAVKE